MDTETQNEQPQNNKVSLIVNPHCDVCSKSITEGNSISMYNILDTCLECQGSLDAFIIDIANKLEIPNSGQHDPIYITLPNYSEQETGEFLTDGLTKSNLSSYPDVFQNVISILSTIAENNQKNVVHNAILSLLIYKGMRIKLGIV